MFANYHTHTTRCHHATGSEEEYVRAAIAHGVKILGFSDHTPQVFPAGFVSNEKMLPEELPGYCETVLALKEKYKDKIEIRLGLEVEYYPDIFPDLCRLLATQPIEYLLLGQHYAGDLGTGEFYPLHPQGGVSRAALTKYVDQVVRGLSFGCFTYLAHPDFPAFSTNDPSDREFYTTEMRRLIRAAVETDTPLEINLLGLSGRRNYPDPLFWQEAATFSPNVVIGCDVHSTARMADADEVAAGLAFARQFGLTVLDTVPFKSPFVSKFCK